MQAKKICVPVQEISLPLLKEQGIRLYIKREDLIHPHISGNKWRKLKYNIEEAKKHKHNMLLTYGGAYSNHIAATAAAGKGYNISTVGVIRGEPTFLLNSTLDFAKKCGMKLHYINRAQYREKESNDLLEKLREKYGNFFTVPEGGANKEGVKGCEEIITEAEKKYDYICCACGTGTTFAGVIRSLSQQQHAIGFSVLKGENTLTDHIKKWLHKNQVNWNLNTDYHLGGYAKHNEQLVTFIKQFKKDTGIPLDPIYTGKMVFGVFDLIGKGHFPKNCSILLIHTGGLQGIVGYNDRYGTNIEM